MSTTSVSSVLASLLGSGGYISLGLEAAGVVVPLIKGLISEIRSIVGPGGTVSYQVLITTDQAELLAIDKLSTDDLTAINLELVRLGKPPVVIPAPAPAPAVPPTQ
jgi:hypothetical protein